MPNHLTRRHAMRCFSFAILTLFMGVTFNPQQAHAEKGGVTTQRRNARVAASDIRTKAHDSKCHLVIVTGANNSWDQDLYIKSVSDLGGGILTQTRVVADNINMVVIVVGQNPELQLMEYNRFWWDTPLTPVSRGFEAFKSAAEKAGYRAEKGKFTIPCQSSSRYASRRARVLKAQEHRRKSAADAAAADALEAGVESEPKAEPTKAKKKPA